MLGAATRLKDRATGWLRRQPAILEAYTRAQLVAEPSTHDPLEEKIRRSFFPERSGDVAFVLQPYHLLYGLQGTNHGTPHPYDTHVPLVVYGPGVKAGVYEDLITPQATASILTQALGIPGPAGAKAGAGVSVGGGGKADGAGGGKGGTIVFGGPVPAGGAK